MNGEESSCGGSHRFLSVAGLLMLNGHWARCCMSKGRTFCHGKDQKKVNMVILSRLEKQMLSLES